MGNSDDGGVYRIAEDTALIQTVDFFTPIVDDPFVFGQVAAANALSDVYAMGGRPLTAMNIMCFPVKSLEIKHLNEILQGGQERITASGAVLVGGHTVEDEELKYGLSVTGIVHPDNVKSNSGAKKGDSLILTKPLGTGILATALKRRKLQDARLEELCTSMIMLNATASEAMVLFEANACTDVTGFGLVGHAGEMARASSVQMRLFASEVPLLGDAEALASDARNITRGDKTNYQYVEDIMTIGKDVPDHLRHLFFDPQTSGGLLIAVPEKNAKALVEAIRNNDGGRAAIIGEVVSEGKADLEICLNRERQ